MGLAAHFGRQHWGLLLAGPADRGGRDRHARFRAPPAVAVGLAWLLVMPSDFDPIRAPVAFTAGILGPLVGADVLHLRNFTRVSAGIISVGGAGTFDGIVLSGLLAARLT